MIRYRVDDSTTGLPQRQMGVAFLGNHLQPNYVSIADLFGVQTRYTVPLFQRYVWSKTD